MNQGLDRTATISHRMMLPIQYACLSIIKYPFACKLMLLLEHNRQITVHSVIITCGSIKLIREGKISDQRHHDLKYDIVISLMKK